MIQRQMMAAFAAGASALLGVAAAQDAGDLSSAVTQGTQFEDALRRAFSAAEIAEDEALLDGEAGVFLLERREIFSAGAVVGGGYTNNPLRTSDNPDDSTYGALALSAGVNTTIGGAVDFGFTTVASLTEYERSFAPDSRAFIGSGYLGKGVLNDLLYVALLGATGVNLDGEFQDKARFSTVGTRVSGAKRVGRRVLVRPAVGVAYQFSSAEDQRNLSATAGFDVSALVTEKTQARFSAGYVYRRYDDFFEEVTFEERRDHGWSVDAGLERELSRAVVAEVSVSYYKQTSTFFLSEYDVFDAALNARFSRRF